MSVVWAGVAAAVVASLFLAPLISVGWCLDSPYPGKSVCPSAQQSLLGVPTNVWIWLAAMSLIALATLIVARLTSRRR
jgi:hypothetical protein